MILWLLLMIVLGMSFTADQEAHAGSAPPSCAYLAADGMRQEANMLLFLVDIHLAGTATALDMPDKIQALKGGKVFQTHTGKAEPADWIYIAPPTSEMDREAPQVSLSSLELDFDQNGLLRSLKNHETPCPAAALTQAESNAVLAQQQRLKAAIAISESCNCITRKTVETLAGWAQAGSLDLPRSTLNLFQPYIAFGPKIELGSEGTVQVIPVPRSSDEMGHVALEDQAEGLVLGINNAAASQLIRTIPYYER